MQRQHQCSKSLAAESRLEVCLLLIPINKDLDSALEHHTGRRLRKVLIPRTTWVNPVMNLNNFVKYLLRLAKSY